MRRLRRCIEDRFDALPFDAEAAARVRETRTQRLRSVAASLVAVLLTWRLQPTANVNRVPLLTYNVKDFEIVDDLVDVSQSIR